MVRRGLIEPVAPGEPGQFAWAPEGMIAEQLDAAGFVEHEVAEVRIASEVHERLVAWRARFGLAIDNALNFLNTPDGSHTVTVTNASEAGSEAPVTVTDLTPYRGDRDRCVHVHDAARSGGGVHSSVPVRGSMTIPSG